VSTDVEGRQRIVARETVTCDYDNDPMQAHAVTSTPNLHLKGVVYVTTLYRCTQIQCRRVKHVTDEVVMPHP